ncbi:hypothetical protein [Streptomyces sp. NPDC046909]|uniref:hypothetical protein n=1 Tax=Streptomyces sp. NPDC046909 TaxID=3155617 RepID=UPI0034044E38
MSVEVAYPVFRTTDPAEALSIARGLVAVGVGAESKVRVDVRLDTVEDVVRLRNTLPGDATFITTRWRDVRRMNGEPVDPPALYCGVPGADLATDPESLSRWLPLAADLWEQPIGGIEDAFTAAAGRCIGQLEWYGLVWPEVPEEELNRDLKHAEVSVQFNRRTRDWDERADDHTVFVHVRATGDPEDEARQVTWVARHVGLHIIGPPDQH